MPDKETGQTPQEIATDALKVTPESRLDAFEPKEFGPFDREEFEKYAQNALEAYKLDETEAHLAQLVVEAKRETLELQASIPGQLEAVRVEEWERASEKIKEMRTQEAEDADIRLRGHEIEVREEIRKSFNKREREQKAEQESTALSELNKSIQNLFREAIMDGKVKTQEIDDWKVWGYLEPGTHTVEILEAVAVTGKRGERKKVAYHLERGISLGAKEETIIAEAIPHQPEPFDGSLLTAKDQRGEYKKLVEYFGDKLPELVVTKREYLFTQTQNNDGSQLPFETGVLKITVEAEGLTDGQRANMEAHGVEFPIKYSPPQSIDFDAVNELATELDLCEPRARKSRPKKAPASS